MGKPKEVISIKTKDAINLNLSEIADTITFIPLSNNQNGAKYISKIIFSNDLIYVLDKEFANGVFIYNKKGILIKRVGGIGKGPNEYIKVSDFDFDSGKILISDYPDKFLVFNENGDFIEKMTTDFSFTSFISTKKGYLFFNNYRGNKNNKEPYFNIIETDKDLNLENGFLPYTKDLLVNNTITYVSHFVRADDEILFSQAFFNTVYAYKDGALYPKTQLNFEKNPMPKEYTSKYVKPEEMRNIFTAGYSHLLAPFYSSSKVSFYKIIYGGEGKYFIQTSKKKFFINYFKDDIFGIPLYSFVGINQNQLIGTINWEAVLMTLSDKTSNYNVKEHELKSKLLTFINKYKFNIQSPEPVIAVFDLKN